MPDDTQRLALSDTCIDVVIVEIKKNEACTLNGPWTDASRQNVHRVLAAIGCLPPELIDQAAHDLYRTGLHGSDTLRVRFIAVGREGNTDIQETYPEVTQLIWTEMLAFMWDRFRRYRRQKTQVDQWDGAGKKIKKSADECKKSREKFIDSILGLMGVHNG